MLKDNIFDVIIIGASLSGASAASLLGAAGLTVALIDKANFPRRKPCGEGLSSQGLSVLERLGFKTKVLGLPHRRYNGFRVSSGCTSAVIQSPWGDGITIQRSLLDEAIVQAPLASGLVQPFFGTEPRIVTNDTVLVNRAILKGRYLIIADGCNSKSCKRLNVPQTGSGPQRIGITATFKGQFFEEPKLINIILKKGFEIYCTPLAEGRLNVSILSNLQAEHDVRTLLLSSAVIEPAFEESCFFGALELPPLGRLQIRNIRRRSPSSTIYLVGDAKEQLDSIGGMGMTHALRTGELAAHAILKVEHKELSSIQASQWYEFEQQKAIAPLRTFTNLCYHTLKQSQKFPFLLHAAASSPARFLMQSITKGVQ